MTLYWLLAALCWMLLLVRCEKNGGANGEGTGVSPIDDTEYAAIKTIHRQLDDNADGSVDLSESAEFVETELCGTPNKKKEVGVACRESEKSLKFHKSDTRITSMELWLTWHQNEVFNWTIEDVLDWLENYVELPQYADVFRQQQITGRQLPSIAINSGQILQNVLSIMDSQHKQKIQLRAMDVVLFGPPAQRGHWKDVILKISVVLIVCGSIYAIRQKRVSKLRMDSFMEDLRLKEEEIRKLKSKFESLEQEAVDGASLSNEGSQEDIQESSLPLMMAPTSSDSSSEDDSASFCKSCSNQSNDSQFALSQAQENVELLQHRVWSLEEELELRVRVLEQLKVLLPECQHKEREQLEFKKSVVEEQMARAQRACEKIKKRRSSLFGSFHLANSSVLEEAGLQITKAVNKMQAISECFEEHHKRWNKVGQLCGITMSSPVSKSPPGSRPAGDVGGEVLSLHDVPSNLRFSQHSSHPFVHNRSVSELVHPQLYQHPHFSSQSQIYPVMRKHHSLPIGKGPSRLQFPPPLEKRRTLPTIPDTRTERLTDSLGSASSSGSPAPSVTTPPNPSTSAPVARSNTPHDVEDLEDCLWRSPSNLDRGSREGSRESSVVDGGGGKGGGGGGLEVLPEQKKSQSSPRNPLRKRIKHNVISSNV